MTQTNVVKIEIRKAYFIKLLPFISEGRSKNARWDLIFLRPW